MSSASDEKLMLEVEEVLRDLTQYSPDSAASTSSPENRFPLDENFLPMEKAEEKRKMRREEKQLPRITAPLCEAEEDLTPSPDVTPSLHTAPKLGDSAAEKNGERARDDEKVNPGQESTDRDERSPKASPDEQKAGESEDDLKRQQEENKPVLAAEDAVPRELSSAPQNPPSDADRPDVETTSKQLFSQPDDRKGPKEFQQTKKEVNSAKEDSESSPQRDRDRDVKFSLFENKWRETDPFISKQKGEAIPREATPIDLSLPGDSAADENQTTSRGNWSGRFDYVLALLGAAVGLGNVWRFPYLCYKNGGGAFLVPFLLMMAVLGVPMFYMQAALAQYSSQGATNCWQFCPLLKGTGWAMAMFCFLATVYYNTVLAWAFHFLFASFTSSLPWQCCGNPWNSNNCARNMTPDSCYVTSYDNTSATSLAANVTWNASIPSMQSASQPVSPTSEYFNVQVLGVSGGVEQVGLPRWDLVLCQLLTWTVCLLCMVKGIQTSGKVVYVTATLPFLLLLVLLIRGVMLDDAMTGIRYFLIPTFEKLASSEVWRDAAHQVFYSMAVSTGAVLAYSSYNRFHYNFLRDTIVVSVGDSVASVLAGLVIFSYLGHMAGRLDLHIDQVAKSGPGLVFEVYPLAVASLPLPQLWSVLFFLNLLMLGLDTAFAGIEVVLTGLLDQFTFLLRRKHYVILAICVISFLLGLPMAGPASAYWVTLLDHFLGGWNLIIIAIGIYLAGVVCYGSRSLYEDIEVMLGSRPSIVWKICWHLLTPVTLLLIVIFQFRDHKPLTMGSYAFPVWAEVVGWCVAVLSFGCIPACMLHSLATSGPGSLWQRLKRSVTPSPLWQPALPQHRRLVARPMLPSHQPLQLGEASGNQGNEGAFKDVKL